MVKRLWQSFIQGSRYLQLTHQLGWVCLFLLCTAITLERALKHVQEEYQILDERWVKLKEQKEAAQSKQEQLKRNINSQSDPAWIELVLKRELGLTPEGQTKVLFIPKHTFSE
jgi:hypothetical protein